MDIPLGKNVLRIIGTQNNTYVNFDCQGFQGFGIQGEVEFSRDFIRPLDVNGNSIPDKNSKALFNVQMPNWNNFLATVNLPNFEIPKLVGYRFSVSEATFDYSDIANPPSIVFPDGYKSDIMPEPNSTLWHGFYLKNLSVTLPSKQFKSNDSASTSFSASNVIIDNVGFSGDFQALNLLALEKGKLGGSWAFSVDSLGVSVKVNALAAAGLKGKLRVPICDSTSPLKYKAVIQDGANYMFQVSNTGDLNMSLWAAKATIEPNSSLTIQTENGQFKPIAILNGRLSVASKGKASANLAQITFSKLKIQTSIPYVSAEAFSLVAKSKAVEEKKNKIGHFPITLKEIGFKSKNNDVGIFISMAVNFVGENSGFGADGSFTIWGQPANIAGIAAYKFKNIELSALGIDIDKGAFALKGSLRFYNEDPTYGKGVKGMIKAKFAPGFLVDISAQFGSLPEYRYWYVDGNLGLPAGIMVFPGFGIYGFGGGASYHMKRTPPKDIAVPTGDNPQNPSDFSDNPGNSLSGTQYLPDKTMGLGLRAKIYIGVMPKPDPFNADVGLEFIFNEGGGLANIRLTGNGYFMQPIYEGNPQTAKAYAGVDASYDFNNKTFHAVISARLNLAAVKGQGQCVIHFDPENWWIYIGHPDLDKRVQLELVGLFQASAYFVIGTNIPGIPEPPTEIGNILGKSYSMKDDLSNIAGGGFGFGARLGMPTKEFTFLVFYAKIGAEAGFDINLKNYGKDAVCVGSNDPVGINGWYAMGQVYAYIRAAVGVEVNLFAISGKFAIMDLAVAAILQGKLPNPTWVRGAVGGQYNILNGLVSGKCKFEFEVGKKCTLGGGNPLAAIKMISDISPAASSTDVNVFNNPQVTFNLAIGTEFSITDAAEVNHTYRVQLVHFKLLDNNVPIQGTLEWNTRNDVVAFNSHDILPPEKSISLNAKIRFEEKMGNTWVPVYFKGVQAIEERTQIFKTGIAPDKIPLENVSYSYPLINQYNYYQNESTLGYIQLNKGMTYLFRPDAKWRQEGRYATTQGTKNFAFSYDSESKRVKYTQPTGLTNQSVYNFLLVNVPTAARKAVDTNVGTAQNTNTNGENETTVKTQTVEGTLDVMQEKNIFNTWFRTSKYNTFITKL